MNADKLLRAVTTSLIALGLISGVIYEAVATGGINATLGSWAGLVIGAYFGSHIANKANGQ